MGARVWVGCEAGYSPHALHGMQAKAKRKELQQRIKVHLLLRVRVSVATVFVSGSLRQSLPKSGRQRGQGLEFKEFSKILSKWNRRKEKPSSIPDARDAKRPRRQRAVEKDRRRSGNPARGGELQDDFELRDSASVEMLAEYASGLTMGLCRPRRWSVSVKAHTRRYKREVLTRFACIVAGGKM